MLCPSLTCTLASTGAVTLAPLLQCKAGSSCHWLMGCVLEAWPPPQLLLVPVWCIMQGSCSFCASFTACVHAARSVLDQSPRKHRSESATHLDVRVVCQERRRPTLQQTHAHREKWSIKLIYSCNREVIKCRSTFCIHPYSPRGCHSSLGLRSAVSSAQTSEPRHSYLQK